MEHPRDTAMTRWLGLLAVVSAGVVAQPASFANQTYTVRAAAAPCLKVRAQPSAKAKGAACIPPGSVVTELESFPFWRRVALANGRDGWVASMYLEPTPAPATAVSPVPPNANAWLEVHFVDVGQGDGIWIHTFDDGIDGNGVYEGRNIVIDGGPESSDSPNPFLSYVEGRGHHGAVIDALIVSHAHPDHFSGADAISRHFRVRDYYDPGYPSTASDYVAFRNAMAPPDLSAGRAERAHFGRETVGMLDWGSELKVEILHAWTGDARGLGSGNTAINNSSIVLRLEYGSRSFLFMGDAEGKEPDEPPTTVRYLERILLDEIPAAKLRATVLKVAHHGSDTSNTLPFLEAVDPEIAVVQSGRKSYAGTFLPEVATLRRLCCHNPVVRIYRTDQNDEAEGLDESRCADGDHVVIRTNGTDLKVEAYEGGKPFVVDACEPACGP